MSAFYQKNISKKVLLHLLKVKGTKKVRRSGTQLYNFNFIYKFLSSFCQNSKCHKTTFFSERLKASDPDLVVLDTIVKVSFVSTIHTFSIISIMDQLLSLPDKPSQYSVLVLPFRMKLAKNPILSLFALKLSFRLGWPLFGVTLWPVVRRARVFACPLHSLL